MSPLRTYADPNVNWRAGAKRIVVNFGDNVPHDNNLDEGIPEADSLSLGSTGGDPGRDGLAMTADDLDLQSVLQAMATAKVALLQADYSGGSLLTYWDYWAEITGGNAYAADSDTFVGDIVSEVLAEATAPTVSGLRLVPSAGYTSWIHTTPTSFSGVTPADVVFQETITVPNGTASGIYEFTVSAVDDSAIGYGTQSIRVTVPSPPVLRPSAPSPSTSFPARLHGLGQRRRCSTRSPSASPTVSRARPRGPPSARPAPSPGRPAEPRARA